MKDIIVWVTIWYLIWGFYNIKLRWSLEKFKKDKYIPRGLYFLTSFIVIYYIYKNFISEHILQLIYIFVVTNIIGLILTFNKNYSSKFKKDKLFTLFQSFNILYQQASILALIILIRNFYPNYNDLYLGIFFGVIHLPLIFLPWAKLKYIIVLGCFVIGTLFSYLITNYKFGLSISFLIHYIYYAWEIYYLKDEEKI